MVASKVSFTKHAVRRVIEIRKAARMSLFSGELCNKSRHLDLIEREIKEGHDNSLAGFADNKIDVLVYTIGWIVDMATSQTEVEDRLDDIGSAFYDYGFECYEELADKGLNPFGCFDVVHESNLSKLVKADEIESTQNKYGAENIEFVEVGGGIYSVFAARDFVHDGEEIPVGKWLKSSSYAAPDWKGETKWKA